MLLEHLGTRGTLLVALLVALTGACSPADSTSDAPKPTEPTEPDPVGYTWGSNDLTERATTVVVDHDLDGLYVTGTIDEVGWFATKLNRRGEVLWHRTMAEVEVPLASRITDEGEVLVLTRATDGPTATEATYGEVRAHWLSREDGLEAGTPRVFAADTPVYVNAAQLLDGSFVVTGAKTELVQHPDWPEGGVSLDRFWVGEFDLAAGTLMSSWRGGKLVGGPTGYYAFNIGTSVAVSAAGVATIGCEYYPESLGDEPSILRVFDRELQTVRVDYLGHGDLQCAKGQDSLLMDDAGNVLVVAYQGYTAGYQVGLREYDVGGVGELEYRDIALPTLAEMKIFAVGDLRMATMDEGPMSDIPEVFESYLPAWLGLEIDPSSALGPPETILETGDQRLQAAALVSNRTVALVGHRGNDPLLVFFDLP